MTGSSTQRNETVDKETRQKPALTYQATGNIMMTKIQYKWSIDIQSLTSKPIMSTDRHTAAITSRDVVTGALHGIQHGSSLRSSDMAELDRCYSLR